MGNYQSWEFFYYKFLHETKHITTIHADAQKLKYKSIKCQRPPIVFDSVVLLSCDYTINTGFHQNLCSSLNSLSPRKYSAGGILTKLKDWTIWGRKLVRCLRHSVCKCLIDWLITRVVFGSNLIGCINFNGLCVIVFVATRHEAGLNYGGVCFYAFCIVLV